MADDQDKSQQTDEPTAKRLEQAREQGDMVKSTEVITFVMLAGGTLAIAVFGKYTAVGLARTLRIFLEQPDALNVDGPGLAYLMRLLLSHVAVALAPFFGVMVLAALAGHLIQGLPAFSADKLAPDLSRLSLVKGTNPTGGQGVAG